MSLYGDQNLVGEIDRYIDEARMDKARHLSSGFSTLASFDTNRIEALEQDAHDALSRIRDHNKGANPFD